MVVNYCVYVFDFLYRTRGNIIRMNENDLVRVQCIEVLYSVIAIPGADPTQ
jgi:hypothetical protein